MNKITGPYYNQLNQEDKETFDKMYGYTTKLNSYMSTAVIAWSSELKAPFLTAYNYYHQFFYLSQSNNIPLSLNELQYFQKVLISLQECFHSGMGNTAMKAYNALSMVLKELTKLIDIFFE